MKQKLIQVALSTTAIAVIVEALSAGAKW